MKKAILTLLVTFLCPNLAFAAPETSTTADPGQNDNGTPMAGKATPAGKTETAAIARKCTQNAECGLTEICHDGICSDVCSPNPCTEGGFCLARPSHSYLCVECQSDADCTAGSICNENNRCESCFPGETCRCPDGREADGYGGCRQAAPAGENWQADCFKYCGEGFYYSHNGDKYEGTERICIKYPQACGYDCTVGWSVTDAEKPYTCQTAIQEDPILKHQNGCLANCGEGFYYSHTNANGLENVCIRYPKSCGYDCTVNWNITPADNSYICQTAVQYDLNEEDWETGCKIFCGEDFHYERPGDKYDGNERVCLRYPKPCGYKCTEAWDIVYANNPFTCQTAIQTSSDEDEWQAGCLQYCGEGFHYSRKGAKYDGNERVCTKYPKPCGYKCTEGWDIRYANNPYTCQTAIQN